MRKQELIDSVEDFVHQQYLDEKTEKTLKDYRNCINKFIDYTPGEFVLDKDLVIQFKNSLFQKYKNQQYSIKTINKYIVIVNKFLVFLKKDDCKVETFKEQRKTSLEDQITESEHKRMLKYAKKLEMYDMYLMIKCFAYVGNRCEEVLSDYTVEKIKNDNFKTYNKGKERDAILRGDLHRELKHYCKEHKITSGYIFKSPTVPGNHLDPSTVNRRLKKIAGAAKINLKHVHPHAWRHLFAINYMKIPGASLDELADILGHESIETTRIYTMTSIKQKKKMLEKIKY